MTLIFPSNTQQVIDEIREAIGRTVTFFVSVSGVACTLCTLDPITGTSVDSLCSGCGGAYWLNTTSGWDVLAHVRWIDAGRPLMSPGGYALEGDCFVTISSSGNALQMVENAKSVLVDGRDLIVADFSLRGVPDINRIRVALVEREG
jgi:hypothetical protein